MSTLTYFSVVGAYYASLVDSYDVDTDPDLVPLFGRVRFTPLIDAGDVVKAQTLTPPTNLLLKPIEAEVKAGVVWSNGSEGVKLPANTAVLELAGALYYQVDFPDGLTARGTQYQVDSFPFLAPTTAVTIDLSEVTPMPGQPATGPVPTSAVLTVNGRTGYVILSADDVDAYTVAETDTAITTAVNALIAGAPGALDTLNELAAALGDDANFAATVTNALAAASATLAREHNSGLNLLMDGSYEQDATWWAQEISPVDTHNTLSTTHARTGLQSMKWTGPSTHYPNVTAAGKAGSDTDFGFVATEAGRVYRVSCWVYRDAANTSSGSVRAQILLKGVGGNDSVNGTSVLQSALTLGDWTHYSSTFTVPATGTQAPYSGIAPAVQMLSIDNADQLWVDNVRFDDLTDAPVELLAPPPTGDRATDTANLQALSDLVQSTGIPGGVVKLRAGTYAADIVTQKLIPQPQFIGQGKQFTSLDGTLVFNGVSSKYSGAWWSDFKFVGSHAGEAAVELNGVCDAHWDRTRVEGTYDVGILFHNELSGEYVELCNGNATFYSTVTTALEYRVGAGASSFHKSGLTGGAIQHSITGPAVLIGTTARPYNAPLTVGVWTEAVTTYPVIQHNGDTQSNFYGNLTVEQTAVAAPLAAGSTVYFAGTVSAYMGPALALSKGTLVQVVAGVQAVSAGSLTPLPINVAQNGALAVYNTADQVTNYERAYLRWIANVLTVGVENGGTGTARTLALLNKGRLTMQAAFQGPTVGTISLFDSTAGVGACTVAVTGIGSASSGLQYALSLSPTYSQSGTAGFDVLLINPTVSAAGSGSQWLIRAQLGGVDKFTVDSTGKLTISGTAATLSSGTGTPEGAVTAPVGSVYTRTDGGAGTTWYVKESGSGNTGWVAHAPARTVQTLTGSVTLGATSDNMVFIGASGAPTLPTAVGNTWKYTFKNISGAAANIATTSSQTIEGAAAPYALPNGQSVDLFSDGSNWRIV